MNTSSFDRYLQEHVAQLVEVNVNNQMTQFLEMLKKYQRDNSSSNRLLSKKEAAEYLGVSQSSIDNYRRNGELPYHKICGTVKFKMEDLLKFIEDNRIDP